MSIAALLMLLAYVAVVAILTPRELSFLSGVAQPPRGLFIAQDLLLQVCILLVLLPAVLFPRFASQPGSQQAAYFALVVIIIGFTLLWITVIWMVAARQRYVHQILRDATRESREQLAKLSSQLIENQEENGE